ncbi:MAG TPA: hypothetical protein DCS87_11260 [Rheinheimera sp.]|nr:hypothetical protein [Rheinheimera sp.]
MQGPILLVDDELNILRALERMLRRAGYEVFTAQSGASGLKLLAEHDCPVILSDFRMPEMNGAEFLAHARKVSPLSVAMILSGYADFNSVISVLNEGLAFKFLQKPWLEQALLDDIRAAFVHYQSQKDNELRTQLLIGSQDALLELDYQGQILRFNAAAQQLLQLPTSELTHSRASLIFRDWQDNLLLRLVQHQSYSVPVEAFNGQSFDLTAARIDSQTLLLRLDPVQATLSSTGQFADQPNMLDQQQLIHLIEHQLQVPGTTLALVYLDIHHFTELHDSIGYHGADDVVATVGSMLQGQLPLQGLLAYLFADQFVVALRDFGNEAQLMTQVQQLLQPFQAPLLIAGHPLHLRFNLGYTLAPQDGQDAKTLIHQARQAARSNPSHQNGFLMRFDRSYVELKRQHYEISNALYEAVSNNSLHLVYQPKVAANQFQCDKAEVLLRWQHPTLGLVSPALFIPIAERDGQIHQLGSWVLKTAVQQLAQWRDIGFKPQLAVNVSALQLQSGNFVDDLRQLLLKHQVDAVQLQLEITESCLVEDINTSALQLQRLRDLGCGVAIDDFGVGYSSLAYLARLPVDTVKLDKSLIDELEQSLAMQSMVRHIIRMSHELQIAVVAEGVETAEQQSLLRTMHCDYLQGFGCGRPMTASDFFSYCTPTLIAAIGGTDD